MLTKSLLGLGLIPVAAVAAFAAGVMPASAKPGLLPAADTTKSTVAEKPDTNVKPAAPGATSVPVSETRSGPALDAWGNAIIPSADMVLGLPDMPRALGRNWLSAGATPRATRQIIEQSRCLRQLAPDGRGVSATYFDDTGASFHSNVAIEANLEYAEQVYSYGGAFWECAETMHQSRSADHVGVKDSNKAVPGADRSLVVVNSFRCKPKKFCQQSQVLGIARAGNTVVYVEFRDARKLNVETGQRLLADAVMAASPWH